MHPILALVLLPGTLDWSCLLAGVSSQPATRPLAGKDLDLGSPSPPCPLSQQCHRSTWGPYAEQWGGSGMRCLLQPRASALLCSGREAAAV